MTVLPEVPSATRADIYDERIDDCQASILKAFSALVSHCAAAGWQEDDVAIALTEMADDHLRSVGYAASNR